ncbi:hypothetical protein A2331_05360 [Candidatus Falkowbacteria bacterium RIFOXYB2_FULL_34_18]|uniref:Uncharacterized protein n=1 Tax=Candidatus Falkowbacteria bacterium RIFOXYD2_FULL_34_120 TaxID=1798007 RepID=A0A1F5TQN2_9BACT|nr:MAG: hypothetical protein A2331_05360 [Candidatus Falkowbacteria bacterium RIFOXYB2_FULL_34_18]OGF29480.1 MAG: hypothetical protein A2500_04225 [Candidatus Falkowbacteria bacterium RIFOXYC12_FULL_34_55]OGF36297.1 MAG: hypothetical protein A2466_05235 [Candidatus Falkowbacteria bacterium RIFOXYC2_FULL_34_220]OGF39006.1 MAG: hypothetical protein A2515_06690 [Candidatus Falkowbacteria bacterium RIFOXYD12_FULL_34_57]OGF41225.1 MAG: hypothetical protein A2531_00930 [Candidatus Falkowbacteria bact
MNDAKRKEQAILLFVEAVKLARKGDTENAAKQAEESINILKTVEPLENNQLYIDEIPMPKIINAEEVIIRMTLYDINIKI